jgi:hypothetical protein
VSEPVKLRPRGLLRKLDILLPLAALGFAGYEVLSSIYWEGIAMSPVLVYGLIGSWNISLRHARLSPARLDYFNGFWWRGIDRTDVKGYRWRPTRSIVWYDLVPKAPDSKPVNIPEWLFEHPEAKFWFDGFRDLVPEEKTAAKAAFESDPALGPNAPARQRRITVLNALSIILSIITGGLFIAAILTNFCDRWLLGAFGAMPLVCLLLELVYPGQFRLFFEREGRDVRPTLIVAFLLPAFFLPVGSSAALHILNGTDVFLPSVAMGAGLTAYILWRMPALREQPAWTAVTAVLMIAYASFVLSYLDIMLDHSPKTSYPTAIQRLEDRHNWVEIAPWGGRRIWDGLAVTRWRYHQLHVGQPVCVFVGRGALGVAWYDVGDCDGKNPDARF